jgi:hypothetical protein
MSRRSRLARGGGSGVSRRRLVVQASALQRLLPSSLLILTALGAIALGPPAMAQRCMTAGGYGSGVFEGFAAFMAEAAMRVGLVSMKSAQNGLLFECHARARACH